MDSKFVHCSSVCEKKKKNLLVLHKVKVKGTLDYGYQVDDIRQAVLVGCDVPSGVNVSQMLLLGDG